MFLHAESPIVGWRQDTLGQVMHVAYLRELLSQMNDEDVIYINGTNVSQALITKRAPEGKKALELFLSGYNGLIPQTIYGPIEKPR